MYIDGDCPDLEVGGGAAVFWLGGDVGDTRVALAPSSKLDIGEGAGVGATADGGLIINNGGLLTVRPSAADRIGRYIAADGAGGGSVLDTSRDVIDATLTGAARLIFEGSATVSDGAGGGVLRALSRRCVIRHKNIGDVVVDRLEAVAGTLSLDALLGDYTVSDGFVDLGAFALPSSFAGGVVDVSAFVEYGDESQQAVIGNTG